MRVSAAVATALIIASNTSGCIPIAAGAVAYAISKERQKQAERQKRYEAEVSLCEAGDENACVAATIIKSEIDAIAEVKKPPSVSCTKALVRKNSRLALV